MEGSSNAQKEIMSSVKKKTYWFLYFSALTADLIVFPNGFMNVWTSSVIPKLRSNNTDINPLGRPITTIEESLLASISPVICLIAAVTMRNVPDAIGRKRTMAVASLGITASILGVAFATNIVICLAAITILGFCRGTAFSVVVQYNKELSHQNNRGRLGCLVAATNPLGNLYGFILGPFTSVTVFTLLCALPVLIHIMLHAFIPESPTYLIYKGHKSTAIKVLEKLRPNDKPAEIEKTFEVLEATVQEKREMSNSFLEIFKSSSCRRALLICLTAVVFQELSGVSVFLAFAAPIFNNAGTHLSGYYIAIIVGIVKLCGFIFTSYIVEKLGRRLLLLFSCITCGLVLFVLGIYFYLQQHYAALAAQVDWLPIVCIITYFISFAIGMGSVGIVLLNDLFPVELMGTAFSFYMAALGVTMSTIIFVFPFVSKYVGQYYCIWFFSFSCFAGFLFYFFCLFETKGKSYEEIKFLLDGQTYTKIFLTQSENEKIVNLI